jgi:osmotically-inducible protein OsmY
MRESEKVRRQPRSGRSLGSTLGPSLGTRSDGPGGEWNEWNDSLVLDGCQRALVADPALAGCMVWPGGHQDAARRQILGTEGLDGRISVAVKAGVTFLDGEVPSLGHKRLAGVLARRIVGCRGVVNRLFVALPDEDTDQQRETAVRLALFRDPALDPRTISVRVSGSLAVLEGTVDSPLKALAAEHDAASVLGVERVDNRLVVDPAIIGKA